MFMLKIYRYITGYVKFSGKGVFPERFLNLCAKDGITVWSPKIRLDELSGYMYIADYKRIRKTAKKSSMKVRIEKKRGVPFLIRRYRHRYGIPVGIAIFWLFITFLSGFCLNISVSGDVTAKTPELEKNLEKCGIYIGRRISEIDTDTVRQNFLINNKEYSWAAVNIKGSFITVELVKTIEKKMRRSSEVPCNIVAENAGKILRIKAYEGKVSVKIGEAVAPGDLLVSGVIELTNKSTKFVRADAQVIALTRHKLRVFVPFENKQKLKTDEKESRSVISLINLDIPLFLGETKKPYTVKKTVKNYKIGSVELPIRKTTAVFTKIEYKKINLDENSAKLLAERKMKKLAEKRLGKTVKSEEKGEFKVTQKGVYFTKIYFCEENIAKVKKILK